MAALILKESYWKEILNSSDLFVSLDFSLLETANAIRNAFLSRRIDREQSLEALNILMEFAESNIILKPSKEILSRAFQIALNENITVYDASYIVLAERERLPLLTLDRKQTEVAIKLGIPVKRI
ncbi:MAG: type II toxin-antitoxin system VapC family toxin [Nitrososphaerota archaeon]